MQDRTRQRDLPFTDPDHEPIWVAEVAAFHRSLGGRGALLHCASRVEGGRTSMANSVTARVRLDVGMARASIEGLMRQVAMAGSAGATGNRPPAL